MDQAFQFIITNKGICTEDSYPYTATTGTCQTTCTPAVTISGFKDVAAGSEAALQDAVAEGPVSIAIEADQSAFQLYGGGVFNAACGTQLDHGVLAVGYGHDAASNLDYWIVKNSWGNTWGESGYIRLVKGSNQCGLSNMASYPVV
jgi:C1A family cysteine protease